MSIWMQLCLVIATLAAAGGYILLLRHSFRLQKDLRHLQQQLEVFVDTSINVARCVDTLSRTDQPTDSLRPVASRRWLLQEAMARLEQGNGLTEVSGSLGLSGQERELLRV